VGVSADFHQGSAVLRPRIVVAGSLAQRPGHGGHAWVFLQYLQGFRALGHDVLFVDRLEPEMCVDRAGRLCSLEDSVNLRYLLNVLRAFDLGDSFALLYDRGRHVLGMARADLVAWSRSSALLLNVMGFLDDEEVLVAAPKRALLDIDPGFGQMWQALGLHELFRGHDVYVTVGENIGRESCAIPTCGLSWVTTPQPIVLDLWPQQPSGGTRFTSVGSWRGPFAPVEYEGRSYGLRVHEFRKFFALPVITGQRFELALDVHAADRRDLNALHDSGWHIVDPSAVAATPAAYRSYVQGSKAEFMVAKNMYVRAHSGWISDRSICYLASGKPVLAQDTGFTDTYTAGEGLLTFETLEEAAAGIDEICGNYALHAKRARELAGDHFDSAKVLRVLLSKVGVS
jgi:hypothetical protein